MQSGTGTSGIATAGAAHRSSGPERGDPGCACEAWSTRARRVARVPSTAPGRAGDRSGRLRRISAPSIADALWRALIDQLVQQQQLQQSDYWLHLPEHRVGLTERERDLAQKLQTALAAGRFDPPWVRELAHAVPADDEEVRRVLRKCAVLCEVYEVVRDLFYHRDSIRALAGQLRSLYEQHGLVEAADYRDAIGLGRKRTIQVLEFFDRAGYTRRTPGDGCCVPTAAGVKRIT